MEYVFCKTPRKADYITVFAIVLFVLVVVFELLLVSWLPNKLMAAKGLEAETAKQEVIDLEDKLRHRIRGYDKRVKTGEVKLVSTCLDNIARYLRLNSANIDRNQVRDIMEDLGRFELIMRGWDKGKSYSVKQTLDTSGYLNDLLARNIEETNN